LVAQKNFGGAEKIFKNGGNFPKFEKFLKIAAKYFQEFYLNERVTRKEPKWVQKSKKSKKWPEFQKGVQIRLKKAKTEQKCKKVSKSAKSGRSCQF